MQGVYGPNLETTKLPFPEGNGMPKKKEASLRARPTVMLTVGIKVVTSPEKTTYIIWLPF